MENKNARTVKAGEKVVTEKEFNELVFLTGKIVGKRNDGLVSEIMRMFTVIEERAEEFF